MIINSYHSARMNAEEQTKYTEIELNDALFKFKIYLEKISEEGDPHQRKEKLCHLAADNCLKYFESDNFTHGVYSKLKSQLQSHKSYYSLYLFDNLLKNHRTFNKLVRKDLRDIELIYKSIWEKVWNDPKNSTKIECLKAMARTWGVVFGEKIEENIKKWVLAKFNVTLKLSEKNEELFRQSYEKQKQQSENKETKITSNKKILQALID